MKLLFLTEFYPRNQNLIFTGGVEARTYYIAGQARADYAVKIIASNSHQIPATVQSVGHRIGYLVSSFFRSMSTRFDLIEASNVVTYLPAFAAARLKGKPVVAWVPDVLGDFWQEFGFIVGGIGRLLEWIFLKLPWDQVIALSESTKTKLIARGMKPKKITVVRAGIDPAEYRFKRPAKFKQLTIICLARLVRTKRIHHLIAAINRLRLPVKLIIVGFGPEEKRLRALAGNRVEFYQNLPRRDLLKLIARCHVFCLPSVVEGFGMATIEAMACGLPAVISNIPVNLEITENGRGAVFFQANNVVDLTEKLKLIIADKKLFRQKRAEALALSQNYTWDKIYRQTKAVYETCFHN